MKKYAGIYVTVGFLILLGILSYIRYTDRVATAVPALKEEISLGRFIDQVMNTCRSSVKGPARTVLISQLERVALQQMGPRAHQEAFILLVCIESRFQPGAKSKVGAIGLAQIMPQYASEFAESCGLGKGPLSITELQDNELNLRLGACVFSSLIYRYNGNVALALSAYNSGPSSDTTKKLKKLQGNINKETSEYITRFFTLKQQLLAGNQ